jgi:tetratricopeptide (TPR) repeat protein
MLWAQRRNDQALTAMTAAATLEDTTDKSAVTPGPLAPAHELLADMLMEAGRAADALKEYETGLEKEPNRFRSVYGAAHAAELAGNAQKAMTYYSQLLSICERSDAGGRAEITRARTYVGKK